ncbi:MAG: hypothetical protein NVS3B18_08840 [Candidatus Dormibacteria bacterium]
MDREQVRAAIRVAVAAPFPEIVAIHQSTAEYADELEVCGMISNADAVFDQTRLLQPDVLLLSDGLGFDRPDTLARLTALAPNTHLVVLAQSEKSRARVFADAVVRLDAPAAELRAAIVAAAGRRILESAPPAHSRLQPAGRGSAASAAAGPPSWLRIAPDGEPRSATQAVQTPEAPEVSTPPGSSVAGQMPRESVTQAAGENGEQPAPATARTVLVFSGKGGVGKSVVATNLATALAVGGARVAMVDLNLQYGDVGVLLHLEAHPTSIESVLEHSPQIDPDILERAMATSAEGVHVLLAPSSPESGDLVTAPGLEAILAHLSHRHDSVVVDSPAHLEERIIGVMEVADQILLVSSFGITSVKDAKMTLRLLQSLGIERERVALVLNQTRPRISFPAEEIEKALRFPVLSNLPYEARMEESVDSGRPMVLTEPRSGFSRQLRLIVDHVGRPRDPDAPAKVRRHAATWRLRFGR